jgi:hypothetical protein
LSAHLSIAQATGQVEAYLDFFNQYNRLDARATRRFQDQRARRAIARTVLQDKRPRVGGLEFFLANIRTTTGREVETVLAVDRRLNRERPLRAFIGHRFTPAVTNPLRHNLQLLFKPYGITTMYSDSDMPNGAVFETIVKRIREADFCVFDDRETEVRPNVLIEIGVAVGTKTPYLYLNYERKRSVTIQRRRERIKTASDLAGMLYLGYTSYEDAFRELAMRLPGFLQRRKLMP